MCHMCHNDVVGSKGPQLQLRVCVICRRNQAFWQKPYCAINSGGVHDWYMPSMLSMVITPPMRWFWSLACSTVGDPGENTIHRNLCDSLIHSLRVAVLWFFWRIFYHDRWHPANEWRYCCCGISWMYVSTAQNNATNLYFTSFSLLLIPLACLRFPNIYSSEKISFPERARKRNPSLK